MRFLLYFLIGGGVVTAVTYIGGSGRSLLSAFVATFPVITLLSVVFIHLEAGRQPTIDYVRGLILFAPAWFAYLISLYVLLPRFGFWNAVSGAVVVFLCGIALTRLTMNMF
ncbi:MAG TPA: DUF3147 domain-containing protein [Nitrospiria bacterium]|nr:DUF3147 domain-containing protein [Nitrospiria bacterium]